MPDVLIIEVSPRDGLQNDPFIVSTENKVKLVQMLIESGISKVEVTSFVHPNEVPQMADASEVLNAVSSFENLEPIVLVPNLKGYVRASVHGIPEVNWVSSATETFNQKNIGMSIDESFKQFAAFVKQAKKDEVKTCFSIAVSFGCPYEGDVSEEQVLSILKRALDAGADRIGIADTIGIANTGSCGTLDDENVAISGGDARCNSLT